jgi:hypothetical protein
MQHVLLLLVLAAMAAFAGRVEVVEVPLTIDRGVLFVRANLNGGGPMLFVFDPGAGDFVTTYARERLRENRVQKLAIGAVSIDVELPVLSGDPQQVDPAHDVSLGAIAGSIGPALLQDYAVRIDYRNATIAFIPLDDFAAPQSATSLRLTFDRFMMPTVPASADGFPGRFELDVRAPTSMLFTPFVERNRFDTRYAAHPVLKRSATGTQYALSTVSIGPFTVHEARAWLSTASQGKFASSAVDGLIGNDILEHFVVTLDYRARMVYLQDRTEPAL